MTRDSSTSIRSVMKFAKKRRLPAFFGRASILMCCWLFFVRWLVFLYPISILSLFLKCKWDFLTWFRLNACVCVRVVINQPHRYSINTPQLYPVCGESTLGTFFSCWLPLHFQRTASMRSNWCACELRTELIRHRQDMHVAYLLSSLCIEHENEYGNTAKVLCANVYATYEQQQKQQKNCKKEILHIQFTSSLAHTFNIFNIISWALFLFLFRSIDFGASSTLNISVWIGWFAFFECFCHLRLYFIGTQTNGWKSFPKESKRSSTVLS